MPLLSLKSDLIKIRVTFASVDVPDLGITEAHCVVYE